MNRHKLLNWLISALVSLMFTAYLVRFAPLIWYETLNMVHQDYSDSSSRPISLEMKEESVSQAYCINRNSKNCIELLNFYHHMSAWPGDKPKAAVYFLAQKGNRFRLLIRILKQVNENFMRLYSYPVIIFHEGAFTSSDMMYIRTLVNYTKIFFQEITFEIPLFLTKPIPEDSPCGKRLGYKHMCRFHAKLVYEQPIILKETEYLWRLDDDSLLLSEVPKDPFKYMRDNGIMYGWHIKQKDVAKCVMYLESNVTWYLKTNSIKTPEKWWTNREIYYNNFELSSMALWRSDSYRNYINFIDQQGGIYFYRWGDAPIKTIAVNLFVPQEKLHRFSEIRYRHLGHGDTFP